MTLSNAMDTCKFLDDWVKYLDIMCEDGRKNRQT